MTVGSFLLLVLIAAICGGMGQALVGYSAGGCLVSIFIGLVGAYLGTWLAQTLELPMVFSMEIGGEEFPLLWAVVGSALFAGVLGILNRWVRGGRRQ